MSYVHPEYLTEPKALAAEISAGDESLRIFDATVYLKPAERGYRAESGRADYEQAHIPGAAFLDQMGALSDPRSGLGFTLPDARTLEAALRAAGISNVHRVVLYSAGHLMWATRAWWLLHYAGHDRVSVLNGGLDAWKAAGGEVVSGSHDYPRGSMAVRARSHRFVGQQDVLDAIGVRGVCTVNALAPDVYSGSSAMSYGRKGHIAGSINLHYEELLDAGRFRDAAALDAALGQRGLLSADRVIAYCGGGISATIDAFACLLVGKEEVAVYDGSMSEWVRDTALPMTTGELP
ncbi:MAG: sulfurtransferase [Pseudomonadales bacterium]